MVASSPSTADPVDKPHSSMEGETGVAELSLHSLRVELCRRNLSTTGLRPQLEHRLMRDLNSSRLITRELRHSISKRNSNHFVTRRNLRRPRGTISVPPCFPETDMPCSILAKPEHSLPATIAKSPEAHGSKDQSLLPDSCFTGVLRERSVWVMGQEQMAAFWKGIGPCGKANLSRSAPSYDVPESSTSSAVKGRAMRQLLAMEEGEDLSQASRDAPADVEYIQLNLVEAYYCSFVLKRLVLVDMAGKPLVNPSVMWLQFCDRLPNFAMRFVAYCRYRSVGWIPRSGIKYGVDWVLYPAHTKRHSHAPYCIILRLPKASEASQIDRSWIRLQNRLRLVKNVAKTLVIASISLKPGVDVTKSFEAAFQSVRISEMTVDRWIS